MSDQKLTFNKWLSHIQSILIRIVSFTFHIGSLNDGHSLPIELKCILLNYFVS